MQTRNTQAATPYTIRVSGHIHPRRHDWFAPLAVMALENGETQLCGTVQDQAALHGLLGKVNALGLTLVAVTRLDSTLLTLKE